MEIIPIREAARRLNLSDTAIRKAIAAGRISKGPDNPSNGRPQLEWPKVRDEWFANSDMSKRSHAGGTGKSPRRQSYAGKGYAESKPEQAEPPAASTHPADTGGDINLADDATTAEANRVKAIYAARTAKLEHDIAAKKLVDADEVKSAWAKHITASKTRILGIPASCKSRCADLPLVAIAVIEQVCREALEDLANGRE